MSTPTSAFESFPQSTSFGDFDHDEEGLGYKLLRYLTPALLSQPAPTMNEPTVVASLSTAFPSSTIQTEHQQIDSSRPSTLDAPPHSASTGFRTLSSATPSIGLTRAHSERRDLAKSNALTMIDSFATYGGSPALGSIAESFTLSSIPGFPLATRGDDVRSIASSVRPGLQHILKRFRGEQGLMMPKHWMSDETSTACSDCKPLCPLVFQ